MIESLEYLCRRPNGGFISSYLAAGEERKTAKESFPKFNLIAQVEVKVGTLIVVRENHSELGTLLIQREGEDTFVRVRFQCQHETELVGVTWLVRLEVSSANYPETDPSLWYNWTDFEGRIDGLNYEASWVVRGQTSTRLFRELAETFAKSTYYYRTHEMQTLENARFMRVIPESKAQRLHEEAERREAEKWFAERDEAEEIANEYHKIYPELFKD